MLTDTISNFLTIIRNQNERSRQKLFVPYSKITLRICEKMKEAGFITEFWVRGNERKIGLKIRQMNNNSSIRELKRFSKPSRRIYKGFREIEKDFSSKGKRVYFISTPKGLKTNRQSVSEKVGGEVLFYIG